MQRNACLPMEELCIARRRSLIVVNLYAILILIARHTEGFDQMAKWRTEEQFTRENGISNIQMTKTKTELMNLYFSHDGDLKDLFIKIAK